MEFYESILLIIFGLFAGILAGFFGIGGGTFIVPAMITIGMDIKLAIGISVMQMMFSSLWGSYMNYQKGNLNLQEGLWVGLGGFIGASFSGWVVSSLSSTILEMIFLLLVIISLYKFLVKGNDQEQTINPSPKYSILISIGFLTGIFAISLGIGGGLILAPLLGLYLGFNSKQTIPISLFFIIFSSISGFLSLAYYGQVDYLRGGMVGIASIVGVMLGISILKKIDAKKHRYMLVALYTIVIGIMGYQLLFS